MKALWLLLPIALSGCAGMSADGRYGEVRALAQARTSQALPAKAPGAAPANFQHLLAAPLTIDSAVSIALQNNRGLQASYAELGIAEADLVQASRLPNPAFSFGRLKGHGEIEIERKFTVPLLGLLTLPIARGLEQRRFEAAQLRAAGQLLQVADQTRRAWLGAVAAQQTVIYMEQVHTATEAGSDLAKRMLAAGNWSRLEQAREQVFHADAQAQLLRARQTYTAEREQLIRLMGLSTGQTFTLPERLPDVPAQARQIKDAEAQAMTNRLDMLMAQKELAGLASSLGLTRATRFINLLDASYLRNTGSEGYEIELQIPLFDWGGARVAKAERLYMQAVNRAAGAALDARSEVRESHAAYLTAWQLARHYRDEVVPLKKRISDEQLVRYNGMLVSVFELLADAREQVLAVNAAIEAQKDYWIADAALEAAMTGAPR